MEILRRLGRARIMPVNSQSGFRSAVRLSASTLLSNARLIWATKKRARTDQ